MDICYYLVDITSDYGVRRILVLGLDKLSQIPGVFSQKIAYQVFPHLEHGQLERACGDLDLIIGQDQTDLQPGGGLGRDMVEGLRLWETPFGGRRVLTGSHPQIRFTNPEVTEEAQLWNHATFKPVSMSTLGCRATDELDYATTRQTPCG